MAVGIKLPTAWLKGAKREGGREQRMNSTQPISKREKRRMEKGQKEGRGCTNW